jgi:amphi-Trp domain-containing protein
MSSEEHQARSETVRDQNEIKIESAVKVEQAVAYLEDIVSGLKSGSVHLQAGTSDVALEPTAGLDLKIKGKKKPSKQTLSIKLSWRTQTPAAATDPGLRVSATDTAGENEPGQDPPHGDKLKPSIRGASG